MSTYDKIINVGSLTAENDLSAKLHHFVKVGTGANQVDTCGAGELAIGVLGNKPEAGDPAEVQVGVVLPVVAGAAVAVGAEVMSNAAGRAVTATATNRIAGVALEAAAADGEEIRVLFGHSLATAA